MDKVLKIAMLLLLIVGCEPVNRKDKNGVDFKFSIDDLGGLLQRKYKANINNENVIVGRGKNASGSYVYTVYIHNTDGGRYKEVIIDGNTGKILKDTIRMLEE